MSLLLSSDRWRPHHDQIPSQGVLYLPADLEIWLATNHKPEIQDTHTEVWSRRRLIPFTVSFEGRENRRLNDVLLEEKQLSGILRWAVEGCKEYLEPEGF